MLERYEEAANNNLHFIKTLIESDPTIIDMGCPVENTHNGWNTITGMTKSLGWGVFALAGSLLIPPAGIACICVQIAGSVYQICDATEKTRSRLHWTLLDYAAESGAIDVAVYLILNGANGAKTKTDNHFFLRLAEQNGHHSFVTVCREAIKQRQEANAKILRMKNDIVVLTSEKDNIEVIVESLESKLNRKNEKIETLRIDLLKSVGLFQSSSLSDDENNVDQILMSPR